MDTLENYRRMIKQLLYQHTQIGYSHGEIERLAICDEANNSYLLLAIGWDGNRRIHSVVFHLRIRDGKIWIEEDWTENGVAVELMEMGIPKDQIVLGFHSPFKRQYTEFAVA